MTMTQERPGEAAESFAALSAAVHPAWHQAILRLASTTEKMDGKLNLWLGMPSDSLSFVVAARELAAYLIDFLDEVDGDPDLEPSLANRDPEGNGDIWGDDREREDEHDEIDDPGEDDGTAEPSLGAIERHPSVYGGERTTSGHQLAWTDGNRDDREDEHDGGEPPEDDEPSLCGVTAEHPPANTHDYEGPEDDLEPDCSSPAHVYATRQRYKPVGVGNVTYLGPVVSIDSRGTI
jgi:hypothetical protein